MESTPFTTVNIKHEDRAKIGKLSKRWKEAQYKVVSRAVNLLDDVKPAHEDERIYRRQVCQILDIPSKEVTLLIAAGKLKKGVHGKRVVFSKMAVLKLKEELQNLKAKTK